MRRNHIIAALFGAFLLSVNVLLPSVAYAEAAIYSDASAEISVIEGGYRYRDKETGETTIALGSLDSIGDVLIITHPDGTESEFAHLSDGNIYYNGQLFLTAFDAPQTRGCVHYKTTYGNIKTDIDQASLVLGILAALVNLPVNTAVSIASSLLLYHVPNVYYINEITYCDSPEPHLHHETSFYKNSDYTGYLFSRSYDSEFAYSPSMVMQHE